MLNWPFKKPDDGGAHEAAPSAQRAPQPQADTKVKPAEDAEAVWWPRLQAAQGDDAALLGVAQAAPVLQIKLAAVQALVTEEALKLGERELRDHDRRVHRAVKQRLDAAVAQRKARTRAQAIIETATSLTTEALVPVNRLLALDHAWQALDAPLLDTAQCAAFSELRNRLNAALREHDEQQQRLQHWSADATRALAALRDACVAAADNGGDSDIALRSQAAQALRDARPDVPTTAALDQALHAALQTAALVEARVAVLAALEQPATVLVPAAAPPIQLAGATQPEPAELHTGAPVSTASVDTGSASNAFRAEQRWRALPPLADGELAGAFNARFERWQHAQAPARTPATAAPPVRVAAKAASNAQRVRLDALLQQAEAALAAGQSGELQQHLHAFDAALEKLGGASPGDALRARHQALQAEHTRLKGWQQWGGRRARDDLMAQALELTRFTLAAAAPHAPRLNLKAHGDAIHALRVRWKELDRVGAGATQAQWQRFDAALRTAHEPVAVQHAALKVARQENLSAREALLATLEALPEHAASTNADDMSARLKERQRALERFNAAWRQLGPLEHTVPPQARGALQQRLRSSVERIEAPLQEARRVAEAAREQLITRAQALAQELGRQPHSRDTIARVRELQTQWQQHARALPLPRAVESALWSKFKAATDAVFAQREAAFSARDAELAANLAACQALLERLSALGRETPASEIERTLAEVDRAWRQLGELPRSAAGAVEARFRTARATAQQRLSDSAQERWHAQCDTLLAKLALCEERERAARGDDDLAQRWEALDTLPGAWEQALTQRWSTAEPPPSSTPALDELLLQLEVALDLPATPEQLTARRELKLRALKDTLEGRASASTGPAQHAQWLVAALGQSGTAAQRERLRALIAALKNAPAGSLVPPTPRSAARHGASR